MVGVIGLNDLGLAVVLGAVLGTGGVLALSRAPRFAARSLTSRIERYVRDIGDPLGITPVRPLPSARGARTRLLCVMSRVGGAEALQRRLDQAGWHMRAADFRARQLGAATAGIVGGGAITVTTSASGVATAGTALLALLAAVTGFALCDLRLQRACRLRRARIEDELPTVLEFLSLCLAAGEGLREALSRAGSLGTGELPAEVRRTVLASGTGSSLADALTSAAQRLGVPSLTRAVDHIVSAIDRGSPLAQVLQNQATDVREEAKRRLIEAAGRKEIAMLLPLVFLLLPLSVLYAIFPGIVMLRLGVG